MITLKLTQGDYTALLMLLGAGIGTYCQKGDPPKAFRDVVDRTLVQGDDRNYTYYNDRDELRERKLEEIAKEIVGRI